MKTFRVFQNMSFTKLFLASFASKMGSTIGMTAFLFYLLHRFSEQPYYATINEIMFSAPTLFLFFIVGVVADRMDRQKITVNCDWLRAFLSLALIIALHFNQIIIVFILLFLRESVSKFFYPAEQAIVQGILSPEEYSVSAGLNQMTGSLFMLFGNALGIFVYWTVGAEGAILFDALSFVISALLIHSCKMNEPARLPNGKHNLRSLNFRFVLTDFKSGLFYILKNKLLLSLIMGFIIFGIINGGFSVMPVYILKYKLAPNSYEQMSIWLGMIFGSGILLGSIVSTLIAEKFKVHHVLIGGIFLSGVMISLAAIPHQLSVFFILVFAAAFCLPFINIALGGWLPKIVDPSYMGRVGGWADTLVMFSQTITLIIISIVFPTWLSISMLYIIVGGCMIFVSLYFLFILPQQVRLTESGNSTTPFNDNEIQEKLF